MRLVRTGRETEMVEVYDTARCTGRQGLLAHPHVQISHLPCSCMPDGHRTRMCRQCGTVHYEPPHDPQTTS